MFNKPKPLSMYDEPRYELQGKVLKRFIHKRPTMQGVMTFNREWQEVTAPPFSVYAVYEGREFLHWRIDTAWGTYWHPIGWRALWDVFEDCGGTLWPIGTNALRITARDEADRPYMIFFEGDEEPIEATLEEAREAWDHRLPVYIWNAWADQPFRLKRKP